MQSIPSLWREELWHPLSVHFPVAFLCLLGILSLLRLSSPKNFEKAYFLLLAVSLSSLLMALWTGDRAEGVVNQVICDPAQTHLHEDWAYRMLYVFLAGFVCEVLYLWKFKKRYLNILSALFFVLNIFVTVYVGHLGASLTYNQAAGVYVPSESCTEFE